MNPSAAHPLPRSTGNVTVAPPATLTSSRAFSPGFSLGADPFCALHLVANDCTVDLDIAFTSPVTPPTFQVHG